MRKIKVLFICLGNICRSPAAEAVMTGLIEKSSLQDKIICDSAATSHNHQGEEADPRMISHAADRGYKVTSLSRHFDKDKDFKESEYLITMDEKNFSDILAQDANKSYISKMYRMVQFCEQSYEEVLDPYFHGPDQFESVLDLLEDGCKGLLQKIRADHSL